MANKNTPAEVKETAVKAEAVKEVKAEAVKAEEAPKAEKAAEEKKPAAPKKAAAKKPAEKKTAAKKPAAEKKPAAKKPAKKAKGLAYEDVVAAAKKKAAAADTKKIKYPIAANFDISGACEGIFYILVNEKGEVSVEPFKYDDYDVYVRVDAEELVKVLTGKLNAYDALADGIMSIDGITKKAVLFVNAVL
ncbi:MAG: SCP2 sterol-binding domain-containing protein [Oscillospiraceae bacterium]|nr:SCP2 sterol-binding domain-containing protein [Oscillospiraceae bacterium]